MKSVELMVVSDILKYVTTQSWNTTQSGKLGPAPLLYASLTP